ncbi:MAG TPA: type II toxin-antitoxin system VapC family toxin [Acetobacteraceae bacterium]|nr:type II toxin-antitoxin system VapC family toxin [Acetobacteraceae bacterium]
MVILDTNVISALMHQAPPRAVRTWLDHQAELSVWTTSISLFEIRVSIEVLPASRRRRALQAEFERVIAEDIEGRVVSFDAVAAACSAQLMAERRRAGRTGELRDTMIAGIVVASHATLATHNTRHFADLHVPVVDPWSAAAQ